MQYVHMIGERCVVGSGLKRPILLVECELELTQDLLLRNSTMLGRLYGVASGQQPVSGR
jgi:hypothetical protein